MGVSRRIDDDGKQSFDGVVCLGGEDWWYHNRGHFDFQIMRRLARGLPQSWPVLFVNSLGVRMPSIGRDPQFTARMRRKLASLSRGLVEVEPNFWVFSAVAAPGRIGKAMTGFALAPQVRLAAAYAGIRRPLLWVHCPAGASLIGKLGEVGVVMQRTDRFEAFHETAGGLVAEQVALIKRRADLVVYAAPHLMEEERGRVRRQVLVTHGVDIETFVLAGDAASAEPEDMVDLPRPRVGFIGGIDAHTFDPGLFLEVARLLADVHFTLIGGCSLPEGWCRLSNVSLLGRKPYDRVAGYMAANDVLIMPWNESPWIEACNPIKLKEYLAVGRPIVTTDFPALAPWRDLVEVAGDAASFAAAIRRGLAQRPDPAIARSRLTGESWDDKSRQLLHALSDLGLVFEGRRAEPATVEPSLRPAVQGT